MQYGVAKRFNVGDIYTFIDIGAHSGQVSASIFESIAPNRIIALEPCKENFERLLKKNKKLGNVFECYNVAYGCGEELYYRYKKATGMRRFITKKEKKYWIPDESILPEIQYPYPIESKTLKDIFQDYNIDFDKPYIIKMDCEGCERFLLENEEDLLYVKNAALFTAELHFFRQDFDGTPKEDSSKRKEFASWICDNFSDTHDLFTGRQENEVYDIPAMEKFILSRNRKLRLIRFVSKKWPKKEYL